METDLKVLVFRDGDKKKNVKEKRSLLSRFPMGKRGIAIMAAVVVLIAAAACSDLFGFGGHGAAAAEAEARQADAELQAAEVIETAEAESQQADAELQATEVIEKAEAEEPQAGTELQGTEMTETAEAEAQQAAAEDDEAGNMQFSAIMKARKSLAELAKMGELADINLIGAPYAIQFGLNANRSMRLLSEGEDEEFIFFPTDFGIGRDDDESELSDVIAAGSDAAAADGSTADTAVTGGETADGSAETANGTDAAVNNGDGVNADEAEDIVHTRMDDIEEMVESLPDPEDVPTKLTYRYNPDMMIEATAENIEVLERIVEAEATDQDVYGRMLVANVVINRVHSKYFKNTVKGVVFEKIGGYEQFAPIRDGRYFTVPITEKTREAVRRVLAGEDYSDGALYFFQRDITTDKKAAWFDNNLKYLFKYGCHEFYTEFSEYNKKNK